MIIYIDSEYKCHTEPAEDRTAVETSAFDGKCRSYIEGYRFVPAGFEWIRSDGRVFRGEMVSPHTDYRLLQAYQAGYEESLAAMANMQTALEMLGVNYDE